MVHLGKKVKDKITGFVGIAVGYCSYLTGCNQYGVAPPVKDGKICDTSWFDEGRIEVIGKGVSVGKVLGATPGGPNRDAPR